MKQNPPKRKIQANLNTDVKTKLRDEPSPGANLRRNLAARTAVASLVLAATTIPLVAGNGTAAATESLPSLADVRPVPDLGGAVAWLDSAPLTHKSLRDKVLLVIFLSFTGFFTRLPALPELGHCSLSERQ